MTFRHLHIKKFGPDKICLDSGTGRPTPAIDALHQSQKTMVSKILITLAQIIQTPTKMSLTITKNANAIVPTLTLQQKQDLGTGAMKP